MWKENKNHPNANELFYHILKESGFCDCTYSNKATNCANFVVITLLLSILRIPAFDFFFFLPSISAI